MALNGQSNEPPLTFRYKFIFPDGSEKEFVIELEGGSLRLQRPKRPSYPDWTRLSVHQCPNCPLKESEHPRCPVAESLVDVVETFKDMISSQFVEIEIRTDTRTYRKRASLSDGVSAMVGLYMVTSGCPVLDMLKPMARTHLPFSDLGETVYRTLSMYALAQVLRARQGLAPDWEMKNLLSVMEEVRTVNRSFCKRLHQVCNQDAALNAVVHLDCFADNSSFQLQRKILDKLAVLFGAYLK